jgi:alpha/beta superfamily hydrolase
MTHLTRRGSVAGPAGELVVSQETPQFADGRAPLGLVLLCHPHPVHGGTMDNKVVQTLARAFLSLGWRVVRFNFRGAGGSAGTWDEGRGEIDDALAVLAAHRRTGEPLVVGGFSFGGYVASRLAERLPPAEAPSRLVLVAPATGNFPVAPVPAGSLVIHGDADDVVPLQHTLDWARPQVQPIVVIPGAGHFFHGQLALLKQLVVDAFAGTLPAPPAATTSTVASPDGATQADTDRPA